MGNLINKEDIVQYSQDVKTLVLSKEVDNKDITSKDCEDNILSNSKESNSKDTIFKVIDKEGCIKEDYNKEQIIIPTRINVIHNSLPSLTTRKLPVVAV